MRILLLSTYPAADPRHGGQHRLNQIAAMLAGGGHDVHLRGVLGSSSYPSRSGYIGFPGRGALERYIADPTLMEDWAIGRYAADPQGGYQKLSRLCDPGYDVIFCEQPWLFEFAYRRFSKARRKPAFIYGSQNIEQQLKLQIAEQYLSRVAAERAGELVAQTEHFAIANADMIVAVSDHDRYWLESEAPATPVVVASNGVSDRRATLTDVEQSNAITEGRKFALYCASSHPPNIEGFYEMFGNGVGCFAPGDRLVIAGGAGPSIIADKRFSRASGLTAKVIAAGQVTESQLRGLLTTAHLIVLPITTGGGTNLKTAEALWSGRRIVATITAMRGFEGFNSSAGVALADEAPAFLSCVQRALSLPPLQLSPEERAARSCVLWQHTLAPLARAIDQLKTNK